MERIPDVSRRRPVPVRGVEVLPDGPGVSLRRRRYRGLRAAAARMFGVSPFMTLRLDSVSTRAWTLMDGTRTVGEVLRGLEAGMAEDDLGPRLGRLVGTLVSHGFLRLE